MRGKPAKKGRLRSQGVRGSERERAREGARRVRDTCGREGESRRAARGGKSGEGEGRRKKKESELLHPTCVSPRVAMATLWRSLQ